MGIGAFIRKFDDTNCDCTEISQLGESVPYYVRGRPAYGIYFSDHFIEEMRQALSYDRDVFNTRQFKMSQIEYPFWLNFQIHEDMFDPADFQGNLDMAVNELDKWLHREVQNLSHDKGTRLNPEKCETTTTLYDSLVIPADPAPSMPLDPVQPLPPSYGSVYYLDGSKAITYAFQAGGNRLSDVADAQSDNDGATYGQLKDNLNDSLQRGTYGQ